uniref:Uncharacterized protein n=1 Tax=Anguilla anguilla TaxID=7936 RepID=A0A0E9ST53_ANGAN
MTAFVRTTTLGKRQLLHNVSYTLMYNVLCNNTVLMRTCTKTMTFVVKQSLSIKPTSSFLVEK